MTTTPSDSRTNANPDTSSAASGSPAGHASPSQPHDGFFKSIFSDPVHAAATLRAILPARVSRHIDRDSLQAVHASFVDAALSQRHGDLMFSARLVEGHEVYLWLLFEHQSTIDRWMPLHGRIGFSGIVWYIHCVHPTLDRSTILRGLSPVIGPELVTTMETYEQALERLYIEKVTRKARHEERQELLLRLLARRFGPLPEAVTARVMRASGEELERWFDRALDAASLDDVFAAS